MASIPDSNCPHVLANGRIDFPDMLDGGAALPRSRKHARHHFYLPVSAAGPFSCPYSYKALLALYDSRCPFNETKTTAGNDAWLL